MFTLKTHSADKSECVIFTLVQDMSRQLLLARRHQISSTSVPDSQTKPSHLPVLIIHVLALIGLNLGLRQQLVICVNLLERINPLRLGQVLLQTKANEASHTQAWQCPQLESRQDMTTDHCSSSPRNGTNLLQAEVESAANAALSGLLHVCGHAGQNLVQDGALGQQIL